MCRLADCPLCSAPRDGEEQAEADPVCLVCPCPQRLGVPVAPGEQRFPDVKFTQDANDEPIRFRLGSTFKSIDFVAVQDIEDSSREPGKGWARDRALALLLAPVQEAAHPSHVRVNGGLLEAPAVPAAFFEEVNQEGSRPDF